MSSVLRRLTSGGLLGKSLAKAPRALASIGPMRAPASAAMPFLTPVTVSAASFSGAASSHYVPRQEVEHRVLEFLGNYPNIKQEALTPTAHFVKDLGLDSLSCVEVIIELEQEFDTEFNDQDAAYLVTVKDVVDYLAHTPYIEAAVH